MVGSVAPARNGHIICRRNGSGHNNVNSSVIVDLAMEQIPRSTERIARDA